MALLDCACGMTLAGLRPTEGLLSERRKLKRNHCGKRIDCGDPSAASRNLAVLRISTLTISQRIAMLQPPTSVPSGSLTHRTVALDLVPGPPLQSPSRRCPGGGGFAVLLEVIVLFDVGLNFHNIHPSPVLRIMKRSGIRLKDIDAVGKHVAMK